ncbi:hypothetical protein [Montanilutibacter psychrotolerans]|uniref:Glycosyl-4,4'-diaponeurosporenoate acyltransferase n=1 Tax=Montanilutibacter psychrotolerans TaxID=1327343 RepID=A0A3M8ST35_9GAMM|nr:hypothetical protein [Lysobacter psychrotolerans]RNF84471.1 hypothetical protein EER27_08880 [Lysobacter psychrotolerans]
MTNVRKLGSVLAVVATVAVFAVCFRMLAQVIGITSPWLWLLAMFYFLGIAKVAEPIFMLPMPASLRGIRASERSGDAYRRLGVHRFGRFLRDSPFRRLNASVYTSQAPEAGDLARLSAQAESAEATHFWAAVLFTPYIAYLFVAGNAGTASVFLLVQALFNVYPILHLRVVRARLESIRARAHQRSVRGSETAVDDA